MSFTDGYLTWRFWRLILHGTLHHFVFDQNKNAHENDRMPENMNQNLHGQAYLFIVQENNIIFKIQQESYSLKTLRTVYAYCYSIPLIRVLNSF